jgi:molecular chaperone GrpE
MSSDPTKTARGVGPEDAVVQGEAPEPEQAQAPAPEQRDTEEAAALTEEESEQAEPSEELEPEDPAAQAAKYLALAQRTQADFENFRKRAAREAAAAQARGVMKLARELLPAVDDLDRALAAAEALGEGADATLVSGLKLVYADVIAALARVGIEVFSPEGEPFDPQHHEAVAQLPAEGAEPGTVIEVYQRGYALGDAIIRPARVVVAG